MAEIEFFEKTGCINNSRQKKILDLAGHRVKAVNLLYHPWTKDELLSFFGSMEVKDWFNKNAPAITSGALNPANFDRESALEALLAEPILIRRPLLKIGQRRIVGFDPEFLDRLIGLKEKMDETGNHLLSLDLNSCARSATGGRCD